VDIINSKYNKELIEPDFINYIQEVFSKLEDYRNSNFTGKMLMHHSLKSSKYMSKWIEEKNRKDKL